MQFLVNLGDTAHSTHVESEVSGAVQQFARLVIDGVETHAISAKEHRDYLAADDIEDYIQSLYTAKKARGFQYNVIFVL